MRPAALAILSLLLTGAGSAKWFHASPPGLAAPAIPSDNPLTDAKVELGRRLFYDADLSIDGTMSCASCHNQKHAFADSNATRPGATGEPGRRNAPGLANMAWFSRLTFADPALTTLETQVAVPVFGTHPVEMGMAGREAEIGTRLGRDACYRSMFRTPSLRNVMLTGPWWHDGSAKSAQEAIRRHGIDHPPEDTARLMAFLTSLSDLEFTRDPALSLPDEACGKPL